MNRLELALESVQTAIKHTTEPTIKEGLVIAMYLLKGETPPLLVNPEAPPPLLDFEAVWELYPRKIGKTDGKDRFGKLIRKAKDYADLKLAVVAYAKSVKDKEPDYIKHFASFLGTQKKESWRDWIPQAKVAPKPSAQAKPMVFEDCQRCDNSGMVHATRDDGEGGSVTFRCPCLRGETHARKAVPQYDPVKYPGLTLEGDRF